MEVAMAAFYEEQVTAVVGYPYNVWDSTDDTIAKRLTKLKQAMGIVVVDGANRLSPEDTPVKEPLVSKMTSDEKIRLANLLDALVDVDEAGG
jgi:hypothetical protein